jgi:hypothetical protein
VADIRKEMGATAPVYAGIMMNPRTFTPGVLSETVRQVKEAGGQGIAAFTAGGLTSEQLKALRRNG